MGRYLTEQGFANIAPLLGEMVRHRSRWRPPSLAIAQGFIRNQGDAWTWTLDLLMRGLADLTATAEDTGDRNASSTKTTIPSRLCSAGGWARCMRSWRGTCG